ERFGMDDFGVVRLGRAVTRASAALPTLIAMALAPKPEPEWLVLAGAGLGSAGLAGLLRLRTWGVLALGGAGAAVLVASPHVTTLREPILGLPDPMVALTSSGVPGALALLLFAAALPFAGSAVRYYRSLR